MMQLTVLCRQMATGKQPLTRVTTTWTCSTLHPQPHHCRNSLRLQLARNDFQLWPQPNSNPWIQIQMDHEINIYYLRDVSFKCTFTCIIALGSCNKSVRKPGQLLLVCLYEYYETLLKRKIKDHEFIQKLLFLKEIPK